MPDFPPVATNELNALGSFVQRDFYDKDVYPRFIPQPLDMWYDKPLYGRLDHRGNSIFPSEAFLKQFKTDQGTIFGLNFVVDAYEDFKRALDGFVFRDKIEIETSNLINIEPVAAWENPNELYHAHMSNLYDVFNETYMADARRDKEMVDFQSFIRVFLRYFDTIVKDAPFTRTGYLISGYCTPMISGLVVRFAKERHSDDENKYSNFIDDPNFSFFTRLAQQYGFIVDKNAPWQLIADLGSPAMQPYLTQNETTLDKLFDDFYYRSYELDIETLKVYILQFYNTYVATSPTVRVFKKGRTRRNETLTELINRKPMTMEALNKQFSGDFWLRLYGFLRAREINKQLNQGQFDKLIKESQQIAKFVDFREAVTYINGRLKGVPKAPLQRREPNVLVDAGSGRRSGFSFF